VSPAEAVAVLTYYREGDPVSDVALEAIAVLAGVAERARKVQADIHSDGIRRTMDHVLGEVDQ
jgi:hypothetical protein